MLAILNQKEKKLLSLMTHKYFSGTQIDAEAKPGFTMWHSLFFLAFEDSETVIQ